MSHKGRNLSAITERRSALQPLISCAFPRGTWGLPLHCLTDRSESRAVGAARRHWPGHEGWKGPGHPVQDCLSQKLAPARGGPRTGQGHTGSKGQKEAPELTWAVSCHPGYHPRDQRAPTWRPCMPLLESTEEGGPLGANDGGHCSWNRPPPRPTASGGDLEPAHLHPRPRELPVWA